MLALTRFPTHWTGGWDRHGDSDRVSKGVRLATGKPHDDLVVLDAMEIMRYFDGTSAV